MPRISLPTPWWCLPNVLSLDAPAVALAWQAFLARAYGVSLPQGAQPSLAGVVWSIYLLDRLLDARRDTGTLLRHRHASAYPALHLALLLCALLLAQAGIRDLPSAYLRAGGLGSLLMAAYFAWVHRSSAGPRKVNPKEGAVGLGFGLGSSLPLACSPLPASAWLAGTLLLSTICWINCRLIDTWETRRPVLAEEMVLATWLVSSLAATCPPAVRACCLASLTLLGLLHLLVAPRSVELARVLADVALLTPLLASFGG